MKIKINKEEFEYPELEFNNSYYIIIKKDDLIKQKLSNTIDAIIELTLAEKEFGNAKFELIDTKHRVEHIQKHFEELKINQYQEYNEDLMAIKFYN